MEQLADDDAWFEFNNRAFFEDVLDEFDISREEVCIIGSVVLSNRGVRKNRDVDFVCTYDARRRIHEQIRSENKPYQIKSNGGVKFGKEAGLTRTDRFEMFDLSDDEVIENPRYYDVVDGFKLLRPEMELSIKHFRGNEKDDRDIQLMEETIVGEDDWDWDLVQVVPPWEKPNPPLLDDAIDTFRTEGPMAVARGAIRVVWRNLLPDALTDRAPARDAVLNAVPGYSNVPYEGPVEEVSVTKILGRQYDADDRFSREDVVAALAAQEGAVDYDDEPDPHGSGEIVITPEGTIVDGVYGIASTIQQADAAGTLGPETTVTVTVSREEPAPARTWKWVESTYSETEVAALRDRRWELFDDLGLSFWALLWPAAEPYFEYLESRIDALATRSRVTEFTDVEGFEEMVLDIYESDKRTDDWRIQKKIHELAKYPQIFRVVQFELADPAFRRNETPRISANTFDLKYDCRKDLYTEMDDYVFDVLLHVTDNHEQNAHVGSIVGAIEDGQYSGQ